jgi:dynein heavy chain, axonemal
LKDLDEFIQETDGGLLNPIKEGDYVGLVKLMGSVMAVKDRQNVTDEMFEPLRETIDLLKVYEHDMPEEVYLQLQV